MFPLSGGFVYDPLIIVCRLGSVQLPEPLLRNSMLVECNSVYIRFFHHKPVTKHCATSAPKLLSLGGDFPRATSAIGTSISVPHSWVHGVERRWARAS